jgi:hypothetical protein
LRRELGYVHRAVEERRSVAESGVKLRWDEGEGSQERGRRWTERRAPRTGDYESLSLDSKWKRRGRMLREDSIRTGRRAEPSQWTICGRERSAVCDDGQFITRGR